MKERYSISVIIPVYNEADLLKPSVFKINSFLTRYFRTFEIIIIESGSTDGSAKICDDLALEIPRARVIHEGARNGYGSALKIGFKRANYDLIWPVTVDLPFPLEAILKALLQLDEYDCVLSWRSVDDRGAARKGLSYLFNTVVKLSLNLPVKHVNSAFKLFKREVIQNMHLITNGWLVDSEIIWRLSRQNVKFIEIGVPLVDRTSGKSSVKLTTGVFLILELVRFLLRKNQ